MVVINSDLDCSGVYLICFDQPFKHARHYLGWAKNIGQRLKEHRNGHGARLLAVVREAEIEWRVIRVWPGETRALEARFKASHDRVSLCPICGKARRQEKLEQRREQKKRER